MFSRKGIETIHQFQCFSTNQYDAPSPGTWYQIKFDPEAFERMYKGVSREDFEREKLTNARALGDSSDDELAMPQIEQGKDGKMSKEEAMRRRIEEQIEKEQDHYLSLEQKKKNKPENEFNFSHFFRCVPFEPYAYRLQPDGAAVGKYNPQFS